MTALRNTIPLTYMFEDDGRIPNNPHLPMLVYEDIVDLSREGDPAGFFEDLFRAHHWGRDWRNGIYRYEHYHSKIHEVLGVAAGHASVRFGGSVHGKILKIKSGDALILPAGTGHECLEASADFLVVGAYPEHQGVYDECRGAKDDHMRALKTIPAVATPQQDPIYGKEGPMLELWAKTER